MLKEQAEVLKTKTVSNEMLDVFSCEAQLNKCTFLSVCLSVCPSVSKTEFLIVWSAYDNLWQLMTAYDNLWQLMTAYDSLWQLIKAYELTLHISDSGVFGPSLLEVPLVPVYTSE